MTAENFFGCAFLAYGLPLALFVLTIAKETRREQNSHASNNVAKSFGFWHFVIVSFTQISPNKVHIEKIVPLQLKKANVLLC